MYSHREDERYSTVGVWVNVMVKRQRKMNVRCWKMFDGKVFTTKGVLWSFLITRRILRVILVPKLQLDRELERWGLEFIHHPGGSAPFGNGFHHCFSFRGYLRCCGGTQHKKGDGGWFEVHHLAILDRLEGLVEEECWELSSSDYEIEIWISESRKKIQDFGLLNVKLEAEQR